MPLRDSMVTRVSLQTQGQEVGGVPSGKMTASLRPPPAKALSRPLVHRKSLLGFRAACEAMWGTEGLEEVRRGLHRDVRDRTAGMLPLPQWLPVDDLIDWHLAVWNGPAGRDEGVFTQHVRTTVDQGFGRVKRLLLSLSTPKTLAPRVASLWRDEYSTGHLVVERIEDRLVELSLSDHPYVEIQLMQSVIAEVYRYVVSLTQVKDVSGVRAVRDGKLLVIVRWG